MENKPRRRKKRYLRGEDYQILQERKNESKREHNYESICDKHIDGA